MRIRTPIDLGATIRDRRTKLGLAQGALALKVGVSRQWIVEVEKGKPRAEIGLLLRTIHALGITLMTETADPGKKSGGNAAVDIDSIVAAAREKRKGPRNSSPLWRAGSKAGKLGVAWFISSSKQRRWVGGSHSALSSTSWLCYP
jgi:HTH-type transcriptional regulator/antitoxin HipB